MDSPGGGNKNYPRVGGVVTSFVNEKNMVNLGGLEPPTSSMSMKRSNQLSYRFRFDEELYQ